MRQSSPWWESNVLWGGAAIVLTVIAAMKKDLRWMLILAWPCFTMTLWKMTSILAVKRSRKILTGIGTVFIAAGLYGLNVWLRPSPSPTTAESKKPPIVAAVPTPEPSQPKVTKPPHKVWRSQPENPHSGEVELTFKDSSLFTEARRHAVTEAFDEFRYYLVSVGFDVSKEVPPVGVAQGLMMAGGPQNGTVYDWDIIIPGESLDAPKIAVATIYSSYIFRKLIPDLSTNVKDAHPTGAAVRIVGDYFRDSYLNKHFPWPSPETEKWESMLWSLRQAHGQHFTDKGMFFAVKRWVPYGAFPIDDITLDSFLASRIESGFAVLDNNGSVVNWLRPYIADHVNRVSSPEEKVARVQAARETLGELLKTGTNLRNSMCSGPDVTTRTCLDARIRWEQQVANVLRFELDTATEARWQSEIPPQSMKNYAGMAIDVVNLGNLLDMIK